MINGSQKHVFISVSPKNVIGPLLTQIFRAKASLGNHMVVACRKHRPAGLRVSSTDKGPATAHIYVSITVSSYVKLTFSQYSSLRSPASGKLISSFFSINVVSSPHFALASVTCPTCRALLFLLAASSMIPRLWLKNHLVHRVFLYLLRVNSLFTSPELI